MAKISILNLVSLIWFFAACPVLGQAVKKKKLTEAEYHLWSTMTREQISAHGNWISYNLGYESGNDTLFVQRLRDGKRYSFPKGFEERFNAEGAFVYKLPNDSVGIFHLATGKRTVKKATRFVCARGGYIVVFDQLTGILSIDDGKGKQVFVIQNVSDYNLTSDGKALALTTLAEGHGKVICVALGKTVTATIIAEAVSSSFSGLSWSGDGAKLLFFEKHSNRAEEIVWLYEGMGKKILKSSNGDFDLWQTASRIVDKRAVISNDGQRLFIPVKEPIAVEAVPPDEVEVWNSLDQNLFVSRKPGKAVRKGYLVWEPHTNKVTRIGMDAEGVQLLNGDQRYAVSLDASAYRPTPKKFPDADIFFTRLSDGKKTPLLFGQPADYQTLAASPNGRYFFYFWEGNWWAYDCREEEKFNLTAGRGVAFADVGNDMPEQPVFGIAGWAAGNDCVLLYDEFDLWQVYLDGRSPKRLTKGRETNIVYRIATVVNRPPETGIGKVLPIVNLSGSIVLEMVQADKSKSGIGLLENGTTVKPLYFASKAVFNIRKAALSDEIIFTVQDFSHPPSIQCTTTGGGIKSIFESNPQHHKFEWGRAERIMYNSSRIGNGSATVFYPAGYDAVKTYPMLVYVYEDQSTTLHTYKNPSLYNENGYNVTNYTQNGYVVLHPNISYEIGKLGSSTVNHIFGAVDAALRNASVDTTKIGLMGHSFGGYETLFTITQTNRFAAAVAGAGISDFVYLNHSIGMNLKRADSWRLEFQQFRMGTPFYMNKSGYLENSPIMYADKVSTPLLTWVGLKDEVTGPLQTMEFYLALRRLGKEHIMLRYPGAMHSFYERKDMEDLTRRIASWLDYKLKAATAPQWSKPQ